MFDLDYRTLRFLAIEHGTIEELAMLVCRRRKRCNRDNGTFGGVGCVRSCRSGSRCRHYMSISFGNLEELGDELLVGLVEIDRHVVRVSFRFEGHFEYESTDLFVGNESNPRSKVFAFGSVLLYQMPSFRALSWLCILVER